MCCVDDFTRVYNDNELNYFFKGIEPNSILYFYYAGHGFLYENRNYLTTILSDNACREFLVNSSISINELLIDRIKKNKLKNVIAFFDTCAELIDGGYRGISINEINVNDAIGNDNKYNYGLYFACSPEQKTKGNDNIKHGVLTYALSKAFGDEIEKATDVKGNVTLFSLKKYLENNYKTNKIINERPYSIICSNHDFVIYRNNNYIQFEDQCVTWEEEIFNLCKIADTYFCIGLYNYMCPMTYTIVRDICCELCSKKIIDWGWETILSALEHYNDLINRKIKITLPQDEKEKFLFDIELLCRSINDKTYL